VTTDDHCRILIKALEEGDFPAAEAACQSLLSRGATGEGLYWLAVVRAAQGDPRAALPLVERAAGLLPGRDDVAYNHGVILRDLGRLAEAAAAWRRAVVLAPPHHDAWLNLASAVETGDGPEAARAVYDEALRHCPDQPQLLYNHADFLYRRGAIVAAVEVYDRLLRAVPGWSAAWTNLGMCQLRAGRLDAAESCHRRAIALADSADDLALAHFNLGNLLLRQGRWAEGFAGYEWRRRLPGIAPLDWPVPEWSGAEPPGCRVLVWNDQGLGDALQFLRFVPHMARRGHRVFLALRDEIKTLAASAPGVEAAFGLADALPEVDCHLPLCSLPHKLGLVPEGSWPGGPYLSAPLSLALPPATGRRVGLVWAGNPGHGNDANRSIALADWAPLLDLPGIDWCSLQLGAAAEQLADSPWRGRVRDLSPLLTDFTATAAVLAQLDLLISVDTAAAHLAGALDRPAWILLPAIGADWRWRFDGVTTDWYPSLRLFRQTEAGDWRPVMAAVAARLSGATSSSS